ncbi:hypothetical protein P9070_11445 [Gallibacterium anatis]
MSVNIEPQNGLKIANVSRSYSGAGVGDTSMSSYTNGLQDTTRIWMKFQVTASGTARCIFNQFKKANVSNTFTVLRRPMLEECTQYTREPSPWCPTGVTVIHGGSIKTGTVIAEKLAANSVTAEKIAAGAINASKIATNAITSTHIATRSLSADKLNVSNLSAISANLGKVTAGTITGTRIEGNTIQGGTISGTTINGATINGGTIRGVNIEGVTVRAENIIGDVVKVYSSRVIETKQGKAPFEHYSYAYPNIVIPAANRTRSAVISPIVLVAAGKNGYYTARGGDKETYHPPRSSSKSLTILVNGKELVKGTAYTTNAAVSTTVISESFIIPANQHTVVSFKNGGNIGGSITLFVQQV